MEIYEDEIKLGLADAIALASVNILGETTPLLEPSELDNFTVANTNLGQCDLYYTKSLLVSTGFNLNYDFFPIEDTWAARETPIDKPSSIEHNRSHVIGHSTEAICVDRDFDRITENDGTVDFDIIDASVIYNWARGSKEENERINKLIDDIEDGKYSVSMEAKFDNFDYILVPRCDNIMQADLSKAEFIKRNKETSFLSQYLRAYNKKANNVYKDKNIGRVLRQITFAGKGYTINPANPTSAVYTFDGKRLSGKTNKDLAISVYKNLEEEKQMQELEDLKKKFAELEVALAAKSAELESKANELTAAKTATETVVAARDQALAELENTKGELAKASEAISKVESEKRFTALVGKVKVAYATITDDKALEIAKTLVPLTDEQAEANLKAVTSVPAVPKVEETPALASVVADEKVADKTGTAVVEKTRAQKAASELSSSLKFTKKK